MQYDGEFSTMATRYGKEMEDKACSDYENVAKKEHKSFSLSLSGLHVNAKHP